MSKVRILIVEDEPIVAIDIRNMLLGLGYEVADTVYSGEEALSRAEELRPSLVLMDIRLEGEMSGIQAAEQIYTRYNIPVIYLTAYAEESILEGVVQTGAFGYILKPFNERELQTSIATGLSKFTLESKLRERERWLSTVLRSIGDAVIATDGGGAISFMNPLAVRLTGWVPEDGVQHSLHDVFVLESEDSGGRIGYLVDGKVNKEILGHPEESLLVSKTGSRIPIEYTFAPIQDDKEHSTGVVLVFRDISRRKQAEAEIKTHESNLQRLSSQLINAQEAERGRLSRELHDEIGQALTAIKINLETIHKEFADRLTGDTRESYKETETLVDNILDQIHQISLDLRPSILDDLGLVPTLNWYVKRFAQRMDIPVEFSSSKLINRLDPELETVVYRVVQEALTNVAKHARAKRVQVWLEEDAENLRVGIQDDGGGFDLEVMTERPPEKRGAGLLGIQERAMQMGGMAEVSSGVGEGTRIDLWIPLRGHK
jgi:PAS domain S-box-containing protein